MPPRRPDGSQVRRLRANEGLPFPEEHRPAVKDLSVACFHTDHLGTPLRLTGDQGQTLWQGQADDWAAIGQEQGETDQPIRFQGQYRDEESGLYYNRYRYYDPLLGVYITQDPIGLTSGEPNLSIYPRDPVQVSDPLGLRGITGKKGQGIRKTKTNYGKGKNKAPEELYESSKSTKEKFLDFLDDVGSFLERVYASNDSYCAAYVCTKDDGTTMHIDAGPYDNWNLTCKDAPTISSSGQDIIQGKCESVPSPAKNQLPDNCECLEVKLYDYK